MSKQHTPTPYILKGLSENGKNNFNIIGSTLGAKYRICQVPFTNSEWNKAEAEANAKFIVKACNSHDGLVEALEETVRQLHLMAVLSNDDNVYRGDIDNSNMTCERAKKLLTELKS